MRRSDSTELTTFMKLHIWGVRGSIPSPGPRTVRYGGNTPCVSISLDNDHTLVLDAGTGLHVLGRQEYRDGHTWFLVLSHPHWDHIQGLPMFVPLMNASNRVELLFEMHPDWADVLLSQFDGVRFPFDQSDIAAEIRTSHQPGGAADALAPFGIRLSWMPLNHEGDCFGYRIATDFFDIVYMTDNELQGRTDERFESFVDFCRDADVLIHDTHLMRSDGNDKEGWGHSFLEDVVELAHEAGAGELLLFHHDPMRSDDQIDRMQDLARRLLAELNSETDCRAAFEGLSIDLEQA